ncbi:MAG: DoxX family protein [Pseudomonadota bacterium]|nr:DoxX family protein [Pseudomonadota bacterium]
MSVTAHPFPSDERRFAGGVAGLVLSANRLLDHLQPIADLVLRCYVAWVFFKSGMTKTLTGSFTLLGREFSYPVSVAPTDTTITLFRYEYEVPLLSPELAAQLGTLAELVLPAFLILGLAGRYAAIALFVFNIVAVVSYPGLSAAGLVDHWVWGIMLLVVIAHGPGRLSIDYLLGRRYYRY